ncbi:MAG: DegT/DnrJ/EryC1/StrS family aminotransferase [Verrucomicrobia bacterium]|nr:DegT/DnrJ/EryC1/StrS family aminotransferase [Verrucomicrobiota bacterium]
MIRLAAPELGPEELQAVAEVLASGQLVQGARVREFEERVASVVGTPHAIAVSSGTAALHLAVLALGIGPGDEVIVPDFTWPGCANVVELAGARAVLADIDPRTYNLAPAVLPALISPRTKAIMAVHLFGLPADMSPIMKLARDRGIPVIEDAACALGSTYQGRPCGGLDRIGCFSFHPRKILTTGEGGMLTTHDGALAERLRALRNHGLVAEGKYGRFTSAGLNLRLTEFQAAIGIAQMARLPAMVARRRELAAALLVQLAGCPGVQLPVEPDGHLTNWQSFVVTIADGLDRDAVRDALRSRDIEATIGTHAISAQPAYTGREACPNSLRAYRQSLTLPLHPRMTDADVSTVASAVRNILSETERRR